MSSMTFIVRVVILVGTAVGGLAQASMLGEGHSRTNSEMVDTTLRARIAADRYTQGTEDLHVQDRSVRNEDVNDDRRSRSFRGSGFSNSGPGSFNRGPGSDGGHGWTGDDDVRVTQSGDVRREDQQLDRRENRREDRRVDRREDRRANSGGELRGLDRANHVADDHGQRGRDHAGAVQLDRGGRIERIERPDRPQRPERPERPDRSGRN